MDEKNYYAYTLSNYEKIPPITSLNEEDREAIRIVGHVLPFKTNNYVVEELINWKNIPSDPIFTLNFPRKEMLSKKNYQMTSDLLNKNLKPEELKTRINFIRRQMNPNPAGQEHNVPVMNNVRLHGIQHKYRETVLFFPSQGQTCHAYCSFCFRWPQFSGMNDLKFSMKENHLLFKYLKEHVKVSDILFTGGDPLTMTTRVLSDYIEPLLENDFKHIRTIRLGTKALSYWPYRFLTDKDADSLMVLFEKIVRKGKNLTIQAHFNHPVELSTDAVKKAIFRIHNTGAQIRTQSPVLRKINDNADIWSEMWRKQVDLNCIPYYMFVARDTGSKAFFEIPLEKCWNIFRKAYSQVSGTCRTVRGPSMSTGPGKIQILGVAEVKNEKVFVLRFLQGRNANWVDIPFFARYDPHATWFDQLQPAFGEKNFFFEQDNTGFKYLYADKNDFELE